LDKETLAEFSNKTWTSSGLRYTYGNRGHTLSGEEVRQSVRWAH